MNSKEVAEPSASRPATLKRWVDTGVIPESPDGGDWPPSAIAHARIVARLRERGHSLKEIREAAQEGRLAFGFIEDLFPDQAGALDVKDVAKETGLEPALIERIWSSVGFPIRELDDLTDDDVQALRYIASVIDAGLPARRVPPARARLRPGDVADRRRRGAPVPHLRARAADARRRARPADGRGDGEPRARPAAAGLADHGLHPPALPAALRRAGRGRPHGGRAVRAGGPRPGARGRSPSPTWPATRATPRRRARRRRSPPSSASSTPCRTRCPRTRASSRRSATR